MRSALVSAILASLLATSAILADDQPKPDYSTDALIAMFRDFDFESASREDANPFRWKRGDWILQWLPLMVAFPVNDGSFGHAYLNQPVDPFTMLGVEYPYTRNTIPDVRSAEIDDPAETLREQFARKRYRRKMVAFVRAANARDNQ